MFVKICGITNEEDALMAVALLGEPFAWYHAAGFLLVLGGIVLAERWRARHS